MVTRSHPVIDSIGMNSGKSLYNGLPSDDEPDFRDAGSLMDNMYIDSQDILAKAFPGKAHCFERGNQVFGMFAYPPCYFQMDMPETCLGSGSCVDPSSLPVIEELRQYLEDIRETMPLPSNEFPVITDAMNIHICLSHGCNLNCAYCYGPRPALAHKATCVSVAKQAVDFAFSWPSFAGRTLAFNFSQTCEPLLYLGEINELRRYIASKSAQSGRMAVPGRLINSNGTLVTQELLEDPAFAEYRVLLSVDGPIEIHDQSRKYVDGRGSYADVSTAAQLLINSGRLANASAVLVGADPRVLDVFLHLRSLGIKDIVIKPARLSPDHRLSINAANIERVVDEYTRFVDYLMALPEPEFIDNVGSLSPSDFFYRFVQRIVRRSSASYRCPAVMGRICVDVDGRIYPCSSFVGKTEWCIGNIDGGLDMDKCDSFRRQAHVDARPSCRGCWARYVCGGGCYYHSAIVTGSMYEPDRIKCQLVKHLVELAVIFVDHLIARRDHSITALGYSDDLQTTEGIPSCRIGFNLASPSLCNPPPAEATIIRLDNKEHTRRKAWRGPDDLSAEFYVWWSDIAFNLQAKIVDDVFFQPFTPSWFYEGDSVRFALKNPATGELHEFGAALMSSGSQVFRLTNGTSASVVKSATVAVQRLDDLIAYAVMIPWEELGGAPRAKDTWGFSVAAVDNDRTSSGWIQWTGGLLPKVNSALWGTIQFAK